MVLDGVPKIQGKYLKAEHCNVGLMEARGRTGGFGFPGYGGTWPRAVRSSRNQGEYQRKAKISASDMGFFELLVTAAGQVMQEGVADELEKENTMEDIITDTPHLEEREKSQSDGAMLGKQKLDLLDKHAGGDKKSCKSRKAEGLTLAHEKSLGKVLSSKNSETSMDSMQQDAPEGEDAMAVAGDGLWHSNLNCQNVEDACSIKMNRDMSIGKSARVDGVENFKTMTSKPGQCSRHVEAQMAVGVSEHMFLGIPGHSERKEESNTNSSQFQHWIKREEGSCMTAQYSSMLDDDNPPLVSSGSSEEVLTCVENKPSDTFFYHPLEKRSESRQEVARSKARDDDDNSSESFVPEGTIYRSSRTSFIKVKALRSRWSADANTRSKDLVAGSKRKHAQLDENISERGLSLCVNGIACTRQRTPRCSKSKRRNLHGSTCVTPELHAGRENLSSLGISIADGEPPASAAKICSVKAASVASSPTSATKLSWKNASKKLGEPNVKVRITSFLVPELCVDLPETATVANLKRAVMEAAMNLLGGGLHVRVLLQGKKVPDESETLLQVGLSRSERLDSLGFMLEPNPIPNSLMSAEDPFLMLSCAASQPATRYPVFPVDSGEPGDIHGSTINGKAAGLLEMDAGHNITTHGNVGIVEQPNKDLEAFPRLGLLVPQSGALIVHPGLKDKEAMALVQLQQNSEGIQAGKRRMRRPFTVTEVEALVQAVEILGTGRWRDVKLRAFNQAKHRTYVDLKDKWKTLVHTARIAPQQRRGEPVPQELLDRVIQAHTYWATQQANQQADLVSS